MPATKRKKETQADRATRAVSRPVPPLWICDVAAHTVAGRYSIPASREDVFEHTARDARLEALRLVQVRADVPAWRPWMRESWQHISVSRGVYAPGQDNQRAEEQS